ncbi:MAG: PD40 domain-containing protein [Bacteroidia bacterium]|nr:PD40 domain-containing protein [Bacteroidia bacterium]
MAQGAFKSEADLKKQAEKLFEAESYTQAFPLYSQLLALYQKDANYNYKFGACMLYANEDKEKPMLYLKYAASKPEVDAEAFYFLGKAYQLNYRFNDAIKNYEQYKLKKGNKVNPSFDVARAIETCNNGKNLIQKPTELVVLEKKEIVVSDFFRSYSLQGINGKLVVKPEDFCSKIDLKRKDQSIMYISPDDKYLYYSSWGDNEKNSRDIYRIQKLASGGFGVPENLGATINTNYDEEYAFMHPDGKTLFFCSKGHNSMGGFDVFKSEYDDVNNAWSKPENVDFPINSPDDDMLYLTDAEYKSSYFSSKRSSKMNYTKVYKIKEGIKTNILVMLVGKFAQPANALIGATISVRKIDEDKKLIGIIKTNNANKYMVNLPSGGKYQFTVETNGIAVQSGYVDVPEVTQYTAYKQQIGYETKEAQKDILAIKSDFDVPLTADELQEVLKNQAELDVNFDEELSKKLLEEQIKNAQTTKDNTAVATDNTVAEDINETINKSKKAQLAADEAKQNSNTTLVYAYLKAKEASDLQLKLNDLTLKETTATSAEKETITVELGTIKQNLIAAINDVNAAKKVTKEQANIATTKQAEADDIMAYARAYEAAKGVQTEGVKELKAKLATNGAEDNIAQKESDENKNAFAENARQQTELKKDIAETQAEQENLKTQVSRTKDKTVKAAFETQIEELKADVMAKENDLSVLQVKSDNLKEKITVSDNSGNAAVLMRANDVVQKLTVKPAIDVAEVNRLMAQVNTTIATDGGSTNNADETSTLIENKTITPKTNEVADNTVITDNTTKVDVTPALTQNYSPDVQTKQYVKEAEIALQKNNAIADNTIRSQEQTKTYKELDAVLVDEINTLKEKQQSTKAIPEKNKINSEIAELTQLKQDVNEKIKTAESVIIAAKNNDNNTSNTAVIIDNNEANSANKKTNDSATNINNNTDTIGITNNEALATPQVQADAILTSTKSYPEKINELSKIKDETVRENAKIQLNETFITKLNKNIDNNKAEIKKARSADEKNKLEAEISAYENVKKQKAKEINDSKKIVGQSTTSTTATNTTNTTNNATEANNINENTTNVTTNENKDNAKTVANEVTTPVNINDTNSNKVIATTNNNNTTLDNTPIKENNITPVNTSADNTIGYNVLTEKPLNIANDLVPVADKTATVSYTNADVRKELANADITYTAYQQKNAEVTSLTQQAKANPKLKTALILKSDAAREEAKQKQTQYNNALYNANKLEYELNKYKTQEFKTKYVDSPNSKALAAELLSDEAESYFEQAKKVRGIALTTKDVNTKLDAQSRAYDLEAKAITKQQQSIGTYTNLNTDDAAVINATAKNNYANKTIKESSATANNTSPQTIVNAATLPDNTSTTAEVKNTQEYKELVATKDDAAALENSATKQQQRAENVNERANANQQAADKLIMQANASSDNAQRERLFEQADSLNSIIARERDLARNNQAAATNYKNEAAAKEQEANQLLQTLDKTTYEKTSSFETPSNKDSTAVVAKENTKVVNNETTSNTTANNKTIIVSNNPTMLGSEIVSGGANKNNNVTPVDTANTSSTLTDSNLTKIELINTTDNTLANNTNKITDAATNTNSTVIKKQKTTVPIVNNSTDVFEKKSTIVYTVNNPIPLNPEIPQGLLFKVQIGAFRNAIPQDLFKGFNPLFGEGTPSGLIRYTAGSFRSYKNANLAKNEIRGIGYKDAFVVGYYNGKRISYAEAMALVSESSAQATPLESNSIIELKEFVRERPNNITVASTSTATTAKTTLADTATTTTLNSLPTKVVVNITNDVKSIEIASVKGLAYTVQVGVYGKKVTAAQLFNIQPLNVETTSNNYLRYSSGLYNNVNEANKAKNIVVGYGIKDAFVTAYYNGKRITAAEAKQLIQTQGANVLIQNSSINAMPTRK